MRERSEWGRRPMMTPGHWTSYIESLKGCASRPEAAKSTDVDGARERYQRALLEATGE